MPTHEPMTEPVPRPTFGPEDHGRAVSAEEFASADYAEPWKYEREAGRLVVMAPDGQRHNESSRPWRLLLSAYWLEHRDLVEDVLIQAWARIDGGTDRVGDIGVYLVARGDVAPVPDRAPDLMFEIVSPDRESRERDYIIKRDEYFRFGIREHVVVDRFAGKLTVFRHAPGGYTEEVLTTGDTYASPLLPGLAIALADIF